MNTKKRFTAIFILVIYSALLVNIMVFKNVPLIRIGPLMFNFGGTHDGTANLVPFKTILPYLLGQKGFIIAALNIVGNIVLLVPVGFLVPLIIRNMAWKKCAAVAVAAGLTIEGMQAALHVGIFDIDDVILNGLGVMAGYWAYAALVKKQAWVKYKTIIITAAACIAAVVVAAAFFGVSIHNKSRLPVRTTVAAGNDKADSIDTAKNVTAQGDDPCKGTGGTGQIVSAGKNTIVIKRHDGSDETITLTDKTIIRNSAGPVPQAGLKAGDRVTVVVMAHHTATAVLVCSGQSPKPVK